MPQLKPPQTLTDDAKKKGEQNSTRESARDTARDTAIDTALDSARDTASERKRRDSAALLPIFGVLLFATPLVSIFTSKEENSISGTAFYIFSIWALLILCSFALTRFMRKSQEAETK